MNLIQSFVRSTVHIWIHFYGAQHELFSSVIQMTLARTQHHTNGLVQISLQRAETKNELFPNHADTISRVSDQTSACRTVLLLVRQRRRLKESAF